MTLTAKNNKQYGGDLINQKYAPLQNITDPADEADETFLVKLFNRRVTALSAANAFPKTLTLLCRAWPVPNVDEPPMVVISSNRAEWIERLFKNGTKKNTAAEFTGYDDTTSFAEDAVAWYDPLRSGRLLFIVVHHVEYMHYRELFAPYANVYVVGWRFPARTRRVRPAGFGASRFAALELVKNLGYHKAWMVDDNVINVNGFPNGLETIEALMTADTFGIGFKAATKNMTPADLYGDEAKVNFTPIDFDFEKQTAGLLQQVVLWNLDKLREENLNTSPYFVTSNEDVSLSNYLQKKKKTEKVITALSIIKLATAPDKSNTGAAELGKIKSALLEFLFHLEKHTQIKIDGAASADLGTVVKNTILPKSEHCPPAPTTETAEAKAARLAPLASLVADTQSKAIEQVLANFIDINVSKVPVKIFNPLHGFEGATVEWITF
jgi:hypothetical protein